MLKKYLSAVVLASTLLFLLIACGGNEPVPAPGGVKIALLYGTVQADQLRSGNDKNGAYARALAGQGASVVRISVKDSLAEVYRKLDSVSGLLVPGGLDIAPSRYKEMPDKNLGDTDPALDELESKALSYARERKMPVLGICRGCQALNVFYGGSLYQDIPSLYKERPPLTHRKYLNLLVYRRPIPCYHDVRLEKKSELARLLKMDVVRINTYHHQAAKRVAAGFMVTARSSDGIVEGMECMDGGQYILGIQFHPELMLDKEPVMSEIYRAFVSRASAWAGRTSPKLKAASE
jgi:putative glutamine amidotransferase